MMIEDIKKAIEREIERITRKDIIDADEVSELVNQLGNQLRKQFPEESNEQIKLALMAVSSEGQSGAKWAEAAIHLIHKVAFTSGRNPDTITIQEATEIFGHDDPDGIGFTHVAWVHQTGAQSDPQ